jgi:hypothetical protein
MESASMQFNYLPSPEQSTHSLGPRNEKARHVSVAGFLFITR